LRAFYLFFIFLQYFFALRGIYERCFMENELIFFKSELGRIFPDMPSEEIHKSAMVMINRRWKKDAGEWKLRPGVVASISQEEYFKLEVKRFSMPNKPDFSKQQAKACADFGGYPYSFRLNGSIEMIDEAEAPSQLEYVRSGKTDFKNARPNDYILLKSVLCTSLPFVNANGDAFDPEDLKEAIDSGQLDRYQPAILDWRHDFQVYGTTIGAELVDQNVEVDGFGKQSVKQIVVYSIFHSWLFPDKASKLRKWSKKGILTFSMACGAEEIDWVNNGSVRVLKKPHFVANSIIPPDSDPADENATLIKLAKKEEKDIPIMYSSHTQLPEGVVCAWHVENKTVNNAGEDMNIQEQLDALQLELTQAKKDNEKLVKANAELEKTEAAKKIDELTKASEILNTKIEEMTVASEKFEADMSAKQTELDAATAALKEANEQLKELRSTEVDRINEERKAKIAEVVGEDEGKIDFWFSKYQATVSEDGQIVDPKEDFEATMANIPTVPEKELTEEEKAAKAKAEAENVDKSDKTKRSEAEVVIATKKAKEEKGILGDVMA